MEKNAIPEIDQRKKERGAVGHIVDTLIGKQSRKVAFGIWLFIVTNGMRERHADMPWELWWKSVLLCGALIGLGTILDEMVSTFSQAIAVFAANKVNAIITEKTKTTETSVTAAAPAA